MAGADNFLSAKIRLVEQSTPPENHAIIYRASCEQTAVRLTLAVQCSPIMIVKWTKLVILVISMFAVPLITAQVTSSEESTATMSEREQRGLRGPVKSCAEESTYAGMTDTAGKTHPEVHSEYTTEYDINGRIVATLSSNSNGSQWVTRYAYDASGRLLKTTSGVGGQAITETTCSYEISCPADYRPNTAVAGSPFEVADRAPNLPGGGSATTIYDEHDRATEVQVRDAKGELVSRAVRTYDSQGHVVEEKQILDNPETVIPAEAREDARSIGCFPRPVSARITCAACKAHGRPIRTVLGFL